MAVGTAAIAVQVDAVFPMHSLLELSRVAALRFLFLENIAAVAAIAGGRGLIFVGDGIFPIRVEHGRPHGIVKGSVGVPEIGF
jgi:class 3 adenylate cyclase